MSFLEFELEIGVGSGREYPVTVLRSVAGEAREIMHFPFDDLILENKLLTLQNVLLRSLGKQRVIYSPEEQFVQNFGRSLFDALFIGEVRSRYAVSQREALVQGKGLRVKLRFLTPKLAAIPWEFMYDANQAEYLCLSNNTPIVRYIELPQPAQPLTVTPPLSILGMTASPNGLFHLDIEREKLRVEKALERLRANGMVKLTWLVGQTWQDLQRAMRRGPWHIFHFIGHGGFNHRTDEGLIALEDEDGREYHLSATSLGRMLIDHRPLRLVVLNACEGARGGEQDIFSSTAAILVRRGIPAVLAMQYEITDRAAIELSRAFYEALADGTSVDVAVSEARKAISFAIANTAEWGTPVLYMRSSDGFLFDIHQLNAMQEEQLNEYAVTKTLSSKSPTVPEKHRKAIPSNDENLLNSGEVIEQSEQTKYSSPTRVSNITKDVEIFFCYAHEDELLLNKLKTHLRPFQRQGLLGLWYDREISVGTEWEKEIDEKLNTAQIILLLISPDFMNSDYCYSIEMKRALERHERGETHIIPVILRHVYWQVGPLGKLQALPTDAKPVTSSSWRNIDEAFYEVVKGISDVLQQPSFPASTENVPVSINKPEVMNIPKTTSNLQIFMCYAREDEKMRNELQLHLSVLKRLGLINFWHDRNIHAGTDWASEINTHLNAAQIILLLVSPDFMDSDFCYSIEMKRALERHERGEAYVIPIILRPVYWQDAPFSKLLVLPSNGKPLSNWDNLDEAFYEVLEGIRNIINQIIHGQ